MRKTEIAVDGKTYIVRDCRDRRGEWCTVYEKVPGKKLGRRVPCGLLLPGMEESECHRVMKAYDPRFNPATGSPDDGLPEQGKGLLNTNHD